MKTLHRFLTLVPLLAIMACGPDLPDEVVAEMATLPDRVDFNQHIRPILSDRCWSCHGPDEAARQAELRLDTEEGAFASLASGNGHAFVSGRPGKSEALARMLSDDPEVVMPTPESKMSVSPREIALISKWLDQGAVWKDHWAFLPIEDPDIPANPEGMAAANTIDQFINERLRQEGLVPNGRADNERLLRRVFLDLTGLPPKTWEMDRWLADPSDTQYTLLVDSLLGTSASAERLTMEWLDLSRYADSHGMHADGARTSYPYRDWIIQAYAKNMPFDQFVREQVAGDLIENATQDQRIASAFNRMHPQTAEGGVISEEMRLTYVFDRVNTVATGMLGLTMDCSRCHDHKFDPLSQAEYYGFSAFFNNFNELGMTGDDGDFGPYMMLADSTTNAQLRAYENSIGALRQDRADITVTEADLKAFLANPVVKKPKPQYELTFERATKSKDGQRLGAFAWATNEFNIVEDPERGKVANFNHPYVDIFFDHGIWTYEATQPISASLYFNSSKRDSSLTQTLLGTSGQKNNTWQGFDFYLDEQNRLNWRLIKTLPDDLIHVRVDSPIDTGEWHQASFTYDGTGDASGVQIYFDGELTEQRTIYNNLRGRTYPGETEEWRKVKQRKLRVGQSYRAFTGEDGIFMGMIDDLRLFDRALTPAEIRLDARVTESLPERYAKLHLLKSDPEYRRLTEKIQDVKFEQLNTTDTLPRLMVSEEMARPRSTYRLDRGAYDGRKEEVFPTTPARVLPYSENLPANRLGLVEWMFQADNPLTARVAVNRYWQLIFGVGIVNTPHDFGSQGSLPSHPQLLDHLATEFRNSSWDVRGLLRKLVLSEAYRRDSRAPADLRELDPDNQLLARGPSSRMPAEMIRDNALAASCALVQKVGGPSVRPYQPPGLWIQSNNFSKELLRYTPDHGEDLRRRSMYTFIKRTAPPPFMTNFDASGRDVCSVQRSQTNTPLQALNLLNDPQFVEASRMLAQMVQVKSDEVNKQLGNAFRQVTGRKASAEELTILTELYEEELQRFQADPAAVDSLLTIGEAPLIAALDRPKTAALTSVGNVLFSFDEAYVKR